MGEKSTNGMTIIRLLHKSFGCLCVPGMNAKTVQHFEMILTRLKTLKLQTEVISLTFQLPLLLHKLNKPTEKHIKIHQQVYRSFQILRF